MITDEHKRVSKSQWTDTRWQGDLRGFIDDAIVE